MSNIMILLLPLPSRTAAHGSVPRLLDTPFQVEGIHLQSFADLARRTAYPYSRYYKSIEKVAINIRGQDTV
jgi:hypothetical protein